MMSLSVKFLELKDALKCHYLSCQCKSSKNFVYHEKNGLTHPMHLECAQKAISNEAKCPFCKREVDSQSLQDIGKRSKQLDLTRSSKGKERDDSGYESDDEASFVSTSSGESYESEDDFFLDSYDGSDAPIPDTLGDRLLAEALQAQYNHETDARNDAAMANVTKAPNTTPAVECCSRDIKVSGTIIAVAFAVGVISKLI